MGKGHEENKKKYFLFDEKKVNPELSAYFDEMYLEYIGALEKFNIDNYETYKESENAVAIVYAKIAAKLSEFDNEDIVYFYEFIHNRKHYYRDQLGGKGKRFKKSNGELHEETYFIKDPVTETYRVFASKDAMLEKTIKMLDKELFKFAQDKFRKDISVELGYNPWIARENLYEKQ